jgi:DNA-binding PadR family transcriptional regulator
MIAKELIKGTIRTIVLRLLSEHKRMYGYEIMQKIDQQTNGKIKLTLGSLYPILHKLEDDGLIYSESENIGKRVRKYYLLTERGETEKNKKISELKDFLQTINSIIDEGGVSNAGA